MENSAERRDAQARGAIFMLAFCLAGFVFLDFSAPLWEQARGHQNWKIAYNALLGLLLLQLNLIAIWVALGEGRFLLRIFGGLLAISAMVVVYDLGTFTFFAGRIRPATESAWMGRALLMIVLAIAFGMAIFRSATGRRLTTTEERRPASARFYLVDLLLLTAVVGIVLAIFTFDQTPISQLLPGLFWIALLYGIAAPVAFFIALPVLVVAFQSRSANYFWPFTISVVSLVMTTFYAVAAILLGMDRGWMFRHFLELLTLNAAQAYGLFGVLALLRFSGYELRVVDGRRNRASAAVRPSEVVEADPWSNDD